MLPSGVMRAPDQEIRIDRVETGLYVVEDSYKGEYDFFAPSRLYSTPDTTLAEAPSVEHNPKAK